MYSLHLHYAYITLVRIINALMYPYLLIIVKINKKLVEIMRFKCLRFLNL